MQIKLEKYFKLTKEFFITQHDEYFKEFVEYIVEHFKVISMDTSWNDFESCFHESQLKGGFNATKIDTIQVLNINDTFDRITLELVYEGYTFDGGSIIVICEY